MKQKTIAKEVSFQSVGLHSGQQINIKLIPSENGGIVFRNKDNTIQALYSNVTETQLGTVISNGKIKVSTIEHMMASFYACDIDNIIVEIDGIEVPIMDGSAKVFIEEIKKAGIKELNTDREYLKITKEFTFKDGDRTITVQPSNDLSIKLDVEFNYGNIGKEEYFWEHSSNNLELFSARTFCQEKDIEYMRSIGLARGGSLDNAMVFNDKGIINKEGFRFKNEPVKHKMLDLIGDLYTSGYRIQANIIATRTGHGFNNAFLKELFNNNKDKFVIEK